jgi:hypothetical protein
MKCHREAPSTPTWRSQHARSISGESLREAAGMVPAEEEDEDASETLRKPTFNIIAGPDG